MTRGIVTLQYDRATLLNGVGSGESDALEFVPDQHYGRVLGVQRWAFERDKNGCTKSVSARIVVDEEYSESEGCFIRVEKVIWKKVGKATSELGGVAKLGERSHYYDLRFDS